MSHKSVKEEYRTRVSCKSVLRECLCVSRKSVEEERPRKVSTRVSSDSKTLSHDILVELIIDTTRLCKRQYDCGATDQSHRRFFSKRHCNCDTTVHSQRHLLCKRQYTCGSSNHLQRQLLYTKSAKPLWLRQHETTVGPRAGKLY